MYKTTNEKRHRAMTRWDLKDTPNRFPWPPVLLVSFILLGIALNRTAPLWFENGPIWRPVGFLMIGIALALDVWAFLIFRRAKTTILPHQGSDALVTDGPFRFSRNPIYVGNLMILLGLGLTSGSFWPFVLAPFMIASVTYLAIKREEAHLAARFPESWRDYAGKVRRWL